MKKIIVWGWDRDASLIATRTVIAEGLAETALWIAPSDDADFSPKEFAYMPQRMLEALAADRDPQFPVYPEDEETLNADLVRFMDMYSRTNMSSAMGFHELQNLFHLYYRYFAGIILREGVDTVILIGSPHVGADYVLYRTAKILGVATWCNFPGRVPNRFFSVGDVRDYGTFDTAPSIMRPVSGERIEPTFRKDHFYMRKVKRETGLRLHKLLEDLLRCIVPSRQPISFPGVIKNFVGRLSFNRNYRRYAVDSVDLEQRYVYFPLQFQPEMTTSLQGYRFSDQLYALEKVCRLLPPDWKVYVKENPKQGFEQRDDYFYRRLSTMPQCVYVGNMVDTYDLLEHCEFVASITGTACWEAISGGKQALIFGDVWFMNLPGIVRFHDELTLDDIMAVRFTHDELEAAYNELFSRSLPGVMGTGWKAIYEDFDEEINAGHITDYFRHILSLPLNSGS